MLTVLLLMARIIGNAVNYRDLVFYFKKATQDVSFLFEYEYYLIFNEMSSVRSQSFNRRKILS